MRVIPFAISGIVTILLIIIFNSQFSVGDTKTPRFGEFLNPIDGFWQNADGDDKGFDGTYKFPELKGQVEVYFDDRLVPHVYAQQEKDAYFVQGYLHAKFRLWQMEFQTYAAAGRLSEILGPGSGKKSFVNIDKFFRRIGMNYGAERSLKEMEANPDTRSQLDAYTAGVNAYISALSPNQYPVEYKLLGYAPEPWTNLKSALFLKFMSFDLAGGDNDFQMTNARSIFSDADIEKLYPAAQDSLDPIIPKGTVFEAPSLVVKRPASADSLYFKLPIGRIAPVNRPTPLVVRPNRNNGSNNWAVAGSKTRSGAPILCNDPHLGLNLPSLWYEMQITTPSFSTYGVSFPGAPSVIIGFNDSIAWGVTNAGRDVKDYYDIQFKDSTMQEYKYNGAWTKATFREEVIKVKGQEDITEKIAVTVFGPVMYDQNYTNPLGTKKYYALRWKAHDPSNELWTFQKLNKAKNYLEFLRAINTFQCPGQNFVFASRTGNIAIRQQGQFPAKWRRQGDFLMEGSDTDYNWQGYILPRENPTLYNPERGYVSSANQLATDETYPYYLAGQPEIYRAIAINRKLRNLSNISIEDMQRLQTDNYNVFAEMSYAVLLKNLDQNKLSLDEIKYLNKFKSWNLRNDPNEEGATIFKVWWDNIMDAVFSDDLKKLGDNVRWPDESTLLEAMLRNDTTFRFVDNINTSKKEKWNDVVEQSFHKAMTEVKKIDADKKLAWGKYKDTGIRHLLKIPSLSRLHLSTGGGVNIINATTGDHGPSWRMVVQMSDSIRAYGVYPGGQSGNPGSRYYDNFIKSWASGKYYPLLFLSKKQAEQEGRSKWKMTFSS